VAQLCGPDSMAVTATLKAVASSPQSRELVLRGAILALVWLYAFSIRLVGTGSSCSAPTVTQSGAAAGCYKAVHHSGLITTCYPPTHPLAPPVFSAAL
jgi:hypothetical protein